MPFDETHEGSGGGGGDEWNKRHHKIRERVDTAITHVAMFMAIWGVCPSCFIMVMSAEMLKHRFVVAWEQRRKKHGDSSLDFVEEDLKTLTNMVGSMVDAEVVAILEKEKLGQQKDKSH